MPLLSGPGPVECVQRDEVVEALGLGLAQQLAHARALELEDAVGLAVAEELVGLGIVERDRVDVDRDVLRPLDFVEGIADEGQRAQPEEVHLEEADTLDLLHRPLGDDFVLLALVERHELGQRPGRDDDAGGVDRGVTGHALEPARDREQLLDALVLLLHLAEHGILLERLVERHVERGGHRLGDLVGVGVRDVHDARDVAHDGACFHRPEGDDLRHVLAPVLARHVVDDLAAAALAEVDVDVGQRHALGVEEALEDEVVLDRIDVGDAQAVGDEAAGRRAAAGADRDRLLARVADEVPDDEEVPGVLHLLDHLDFVAEPALVLVDRVAQDAARLEILQAAAGGTRSLRGPPARSTRRA